MSTAPNAPPSYDEHSNFSNQPPNMPPLPQQQSIPVQQYPMPLPPPQQPPPPGQMTVITQQPSTVVVRTIPILGPLPVTITCPQCFSFTTTTTKTEISTRTHCCALGLCLVGLWPCVVLPYICGGCCKKTVHTCSNCGSFVGSY